MPVFFFEKTALSASGTGALAKLKAYDKRQRAALMKAVDSKGPGIIAEQRKQQLGISYSEFRSLIGRVNKNKDFQLSGEMWLKFGVKRQQKNEDGFSIFIGGTTELAQNKIDWNSKREGISIVEASKEEHALVEQGIKRLIENKIANLNF